MAMTRKIDRRQALSAFGTVSLGALLAACGEDNVPTTDGGSATVEPQATTSPDTASRFGQDSNCTLTPEMTEGPYYFDADAIRSDIREDREGTELRVAIRVRDSECEPLSNAVVDIWHCDAGGLYSGFESASTGGARDERSDDERYLRGAQVTNKDGIAEFTTIYPGWYRGRTVHIHAKVHLDRSTVLTTQLFFDDDVSARVYEREPYRSHGERDQFNDSDGLFDEALLLELSREGDAYVGTISFDVAAS
jgi:protocatechuate 3,4-dioxygenase beta subunit